MSDDTMKALKAEADALGIKYHNSISEATLFERIALYKQEQADLAAVEAIKGADEKKKQDTSAEDAAMAAAKEANKLVRCQIAAMNPQERDIGYKLFDCGNKYTGKIAKVIPFNKPWHVPQIILDYIKEQQFVTAKMVKGEGGREVMQTVWAPAYSVNILDPLTDAELKQIAAAQGTLVEEQ